MTKRQIKEHKLGNQIRKERFRKLYFKADWQKNSWIPLAGLCQDGKYTNQAKATV